MAGALIVIEIAAPKVSSDALAVLVSACSRAARDAECVLARNESDAQPAAVAIVTLQSADKMRVEVGVRHGGHDSWRTRDFAFLAADKSMDRWRAVGFAIGTLAERYPTPEEETSTRVGPGAPLPSPPSSPSPASTSTPSPASTSTPGPASTSTPSPASTSTPSPSPTPAPASTSSADTDSSAESERPAAPQARRSASGTQMFVGAAAIFGPGLETDPPWRLGGALYADLALSRVPIFFTVGGSAATRLDGGTSEVTTRWFDVLLGAGVPLLGRLDASGLELRAQVFAEYFYAHASALGRSQTMSRWALGLQGAFGGRVQIMPDLFLTAEVQAAGLSGETEVVVGSETIGSSASFRYLGGLGLRVRLR